MFSNKNIIVVAPDKYKDFARELSHNISKQDECTSSYWSIKHYENNESTICGDQFVIFIGNHEENSLTKGFIKVIRNLKNNYGACYGYDGSKAVLFGEGKENQLSQIGLIRETAIASVGSLGVSTGIGSAIAVGFVAALPFAIIGGSIYAIYSYFSKQRKLESLKEEQTKLALTLFMSESFDNWIK